MDALTERDRLILESMDGEPVTARELQMRIFTADRGQNLVSQVLARHLRALERLGFVERAAPGFWRRTQKVLDT